MAWWNIFTTSEKAIDTAANIINGAVSGLDALFFTEEEKAKVSQQTMDTWLKMQAAIADESSVRSITRRRIAQAFIYTFLLFLIVGGILYPFNVEWATHVLGLAKQMTTPVLVILGFYFGYFAISNVVGAAKK